MDCRKFEEYSSLYIDHMLSKEELTSFEAHLENCEECKMKLKNLQLIVESINEVDEIELLDNFTASLREKLQQIEAKPKRKKWLNWKTYSAVAAGLVILVFSASFLNRGNFNISMDQAGPHSFSAEDSRSFGISGGKPEQEVMPQDSFVNESHGDVNNQALEKEKSSQQELSMTLNENIDENEMQEMAVANDQTRKLIEKGSLWLETNNFDQVHGQVLALVEKYNGYVQQSESYYRLLNRENPEESLRAANLTLRIPKDQFKSVFEALRGMGTVVNENINVEDVTITYRDLETETRNLELQEERLREILQRAEAVEDILQIEKELNRVRTRIDSAKTALRGYDQLITLSTIQLEIEEVKEVNAKIKASNDGLWNKARNSFIQSVNGIIYFGEILFIKLFGMIPVILILSVIGLPIGFIIYKKVKKRRI